MKAHLKARFIALVSLLLVISMFLSSCGLIARIRGDVEDALTSSTPEGCTHAETVRTGEKAATCYEKGYTGDLVCKACTTIVTPGSELPMLDHTYGIGVITKQPTCMEPGVTTYTCSGCGGVQTTSIATVAHDDAYHDAQDGTHFHTCKNCPLNVNAEHTPVDAGVYHAATCTKPAYTEYVCADCDGAYAVYSTTEVATGHTLSKWAVEVETTCATDGLKSQHCTNPGCEYENTIDVPSSGSHFLLFQRYDQAPNCCEGGTASYKCRYCTHTETRAVAKNGIHNYAFLEDTGDGFMRKECSICHDLIVSYNAVSSVSATLKTENISKDTALEMAMENAAIQFPAGVVSQVTAGTDVAISADVVEGSTKAAAINKVTDADKKAALEDALIYDFTVTVDNQVFTDNFNDKVAITVPYDSGDADIDGLVIYYLANNGEIEEITDLVYDPETQQLTFFVSHFSYYAVAYRETQEMRCKRGLHEYEATDTTVVASCYSFGYTVYECICCHNTTIDDIVERIAHEYGPIIEAKPTCDRGDYVKRICQNDGCGDVFYVEFKGATGHTMDAPATCSTSSTCTKCGTVLVRPLGHNWTEWETVVEATESKNGIRRRYCLTCGKVDEATLASSGTIEAIEFETYTDLVNLVLDDLLKIAGGTVSFSLLDYTLKTDITAEVQKDANGYKIHAKITQTRYTDITLTEINWSDTQECYYDNGVFVGIEDDKYGIGTDIEALVPYGIDVYKQILEELHAYLDDYVREYLGVTRDLLDEYKEMFGADIDKILADAGSPYTVNELDNVIDSIESVYAYLSLKLGYTTAQQIKDGIVLPTDEDIKAVLAAFMSVSEKNGVTTYSLAAAPILSATDAILDYFKERLDMTLAEFIYELISEDALAHKNTLTDFDSVIAYIESELPGTLTLSDAVDKLVDLSEESGRFTLEDIYNLIDKIALNVYDEEFDSEQFIKDNGTKTLDELLQAAFDDEEATAAALYDLVIEYANEITVGEIEVDYYYTFEDFVNDSIELLENSDITGSFSFSVDAEGRLLNVELDHDIHYSENGEVHEIEHLLISVVRDTSVTVTLPEALRAAYRDVSSYYDANGNLVIEGLDPTLDYTFSAEGSGRIDADEALVLDATLTAERGYNVYVTKPEYWTNMSHVGEYYKYNGKYYQRNNGKYIYVYVNSSLVTPAEYFDDVDAPPAADAEAIGYLEGYTEEIPVYSHALGIVYQLNGVWRVACDYGTVANSVKGTGYYVVSDAPLVGIADSLTLSSTKKQGSDYIYDYYYGYSYYVEIDGQYYDLLTAYYTVAGSTRTLSVSAVMVDGELMVVKNPYYYSGYYVYDLSNAVDTLPAHDSQSTYQSTIMISDGNGGIVKVAVENVYLYTYLPSYYVKVADGQYTALDSYYLRENYVASGDAMPLPDGNTLYVLGTNTENYYAYKYGYEVTYGYTRIPSGHHLRTMVLTEDGEIVRVIYQGVTEAVHVDYDRVCDLSEYTTYANGKYTVAARALATLADYCRYDGNSYTIQILSRVMVGDVDFEFGYYVGGEVKLPEDIAGAVLDEYNDPDGNLFYDLFDEIPSGKSYAVTKNADGSITISFADGAQISGLRYNLGNVMPVDGILVRDDEQSASNGLEIYKYEVSGTNEFTDSSTYLYKDGKYYNYYTLSTYRFNYVASLEDLWDDWYISSMTYRFDTIGAPGLPATLSVYETYVRLARSWDGYYGFTCYTFFLEGKMQVALGATVTGESLLTFDGYMPFDAYMASLRFDLQEYNSSWGTYYVDGADVQVYYDGVEVYDTNGDYITSFSVKYVKNGTAKKYVRSYSYSYDDRLEIGNEVTPSAEALAGTRSEYTNNYRNGVFTFVRFSYTYTSSYHNVYRYIKLAGRYYQYDWDYYGYSDSYRDVRLSQYQFNNQAIDKVWYYMVEDPNNGEKTYYTEFIPSDYGFAPSGSIVDPDTITGSLYNTTLLGYTANGEALYEVAYYMTEGSSSFDYTVEEQADGTVFYHVDGVGYLKDQAGYYVRARKVTMQDGTTGIVCFIRGAYIRDDVLNNYDHDFMDAYVSVGWNTVTIQEEFLEIAGYAKTNFNLRIEYTYDSGYWNYEYFDYYMLETCFMQ